MSRPNLAGQKDFCRLRGRSTEIHAIEQIDWFRVECPLKHPDVQRDVYETFDWQPIGNRGDHPCGAQGTEAAPG
uniref:Uncharacterized protein n=1 Tax=Ralstonia solanacearum TaxID=305 RepID=A0A0S4U217_RALSL|nr:protein of unknown function [Ralstonia solanacearum]CUV30942.1 protein of unknown function [Ralstonia solanacearum]